MLFVEKPEKPLLFAAEAGEFYPRSREVPSWQSANFQAKSNYRGVRDAAAGLKMAKNRERCGVVTMPQDFTIMLYICIIYIKKFGREVFSMFLVFALLKVQRWKQNVEMSPEKGCWLPQSFHAPHGGFLFPTTGFSPIGTEEGGLSSA